MEPRLKDQKNVMVGAGCTSCACDANWKSFLFLLLVNVMLLPTIWLSDGLGGCILAVCDGASVEGSEECDGGAGCTLPPVMPTGRSASCFSDL